MGASGSQVAQIVPPVPVLGTLGRALGYVNLQSISQRPAEAYHENHYANVSAICRIFERLSVGLEGSLEGVELNAIRTACASSSASSDGLGR